MISRKANILMSWGRNAFTLVELLVSMTVLAILLIILMSMVDSATKLWKQSENRVDSYREGRAAVNMIADDVSTILVSTNTEFFSLNTAAQLPDSAKEPSVANNIFFLSALPKGAQDQDSEAVHEGSSKEKNKGNVCVIGYFLAYDKISSSSPLASLNLYRYLLSSGGTLSAIQQKKLLTEKLSTLPSAVAPSGSEVLARNVTDFKIAPYTVDASGAIQKFTQSPQTPFPDFLDIQLTVLNNETIKRFKPGDESDWADQSSISFRQIARTFRTRAHLHTEAVSNFTPVPIPTPEPESK